MLALLRFILIHDEKVLSQKFPLYFNQFMSHFSNHPNSREDGPNADHCRGVVRFLLVTIPYCLHVS